MRQQILTLQNDNMIEKINSRRGKSKSYYKLLSYIYERKHERKEGKGEQRNRFKKH